MRDKLIELIGDAPYGLRTLGQAADELISVERIADHLISHGVTFATDTYVGSKPMTNGDRIRAMTDEELTEFILDKRENGTCFNNKCYYYDPNKGCDDCTLEWLKQPVR